MAQLAQRTGTGQRLLAAGSLAPLHLGILPVTAQRPVGGMGAILNFQHTVRGPAQDQTCLRRGRGQGLAPQSGVVGGQGMAPDTGIGHLLLESDFEHYARCAGRSVWLDKTRS